MEAVSLSALDLLLALGSNELVSFMWLALLMDVPRYLLTAAVVAVVSEGDGKGGGEAAGRRKVCAVIAAHNEAHAIAACVESLKAQVDAVVVVDDGSTDATLIRAATLGGRLVCLPNRSGKALAINAGIAQGVSSDFDFVLISDADTILEPDAVARALRYFDERVGGVGLRLRPRNEAETLTCAFQSIEYAILAAGKRLSDSLGMLSNVSGAAGLFRREAIEQVGGLDCEVADDAALAMKLRAADWRLRYAFDAVARTAVPETLTDLTLQRLRWDASIVTIWWRKFGYFLYPFSRVSASNLLTSLDVVAFNLIMPLILPVYLWWMTDRIGAASLILLAAVMIGLALIDLVIVLLAGVSVGLLVYVPLFVAMQTLVMRPLRIVALVGELAFGITRYDPYIPRSERWRLT